MNQQRPSRKPLGRSTGRNVDLSMKQEFKDYVLCTGRTVRFMPFKVDAGEVETLTCAHPMNKRIGDDLTKASLAGMIESIKRQQYMPVICQKIGDIYNAMDGSRRRQAAIFAKVGLQGIYCDEELTKAEIKALSKELQSAKEHSVRENGQNFAILMEEDSTLTQEVIAEQEGFTQGYVSKALQAWELPQELVDVYPRPSDITLVEFAKLSKLVSALTKDKKSVSSFINEIEVADGTLSEDVTKLLEKTSGISVKVSPKVAVKFATVNKNKWASVKKVKDKTTITLNRATEEEYAQIEKYIKDVLEK